MVRDILESLFGGSTQPQGQEVEAAPAQAGQGRQDLLEQMRQGGQTYSGGNMTPEDAQNTKEYFKKLDPTLPDHVIDFNMADPDRLTAFSRKVHDKWFKDRGRRVDTVDQLDQIILQGVEDHKLQALLRLAVRRGGGAVVNPLIKRRVDELRGDDKTGVRDQVLQGLPPEDQALVRAMTDAQFGKFAQDQLNERAKTRAAGGMRFEPVEGKPRLRILQDDAFLRSGYKSGDTVCIKIP